MFIVIIYFIQRNTLIKYNVGLWVVIIHNRTFFAMQK